MNRGNDQSDQSLKGYFRRRSYIPLQDLFIVDLEERLLSDVLTLFQFGLFLFKTLYSGVAVETVISYSQKLNNF